MRGWSVELRYCRPTPKPGEVPDANYVVIGPNYFRTLQIPLRIGRPFRDADRPGAQPVVIVSDSLAGKYWPGQDPIGKRLEIVPTQTTRPSLAGSRRRGRQCQKWSVRSFHSRTLCSHTQHPWILWPHNILVRTEEIRWRSWRQSGREIGALEKDVPVSDINTMDEIVAGPVQGKAVMWLLGSLAGLARSLCLRSGSAA